MLLSAERPIAVRIDTAFFIYASSAAQGRPRDRTHVPHKPKLAHRMIVAIAVTMLWTTTVATAQTTEQGMATFYKDSFQGRKTASGDIFDQKGLTGAHKKHPFGTKVRLTNLANGQSVVVTINDRMDNKNPTLIDVTRRAAKELGFIQKGEAKVKLEVVE
jgi:rare lipoprotein A